MRRLQSVKLAILSALVVALLPLSTMFPQVHPVIAATPSNLMLNGDFSNGLLGWTSSKTSKVWGVRGEYPIFEVLKRNPGYSGGQAMPDTCFPSQRMGNPFLNIEVPFGASGYVEQSATIPAFGPAQLSFLSWGWEGNNPALGFSGLVNASVSVVDSNNIQHNLETYTPPPMFTPTGTVSSPSASCIGNVPVFKTYDFSAYLGQKVKIRLGAISQKSQNCCGTNAFFDDVDLEAQGIAFHCSPQAGFQALSNSCAIPNAVVGTPYSYYFQISGGLPPYTGSISDSDCCPPGMIVGGTPPQISGTPTQAGVYPLLFSFQDSGQGQDKNVIFVPITLTVTPIITNVTPYSGILPAAGPANGGTAVNITGVGFKGTTGVKFNSTKVPCGFFGCDFQVINDSLIHVKAPRSPGCLYDQPIICPPLVPGLANVTVLVNGYSSGFWCPTPVNFTAGPRCNQFNYTPKQQAPFCTSGPGISPPPSWDFDLRTGADTGVGIGLSGSFSAAPHTKMCIQMDGWKLKLFNFTATVDVNASLSASVSISASKDNLGNPFPLGDPIQSSPIAIGPVVIVPTLTPVLMYEAYAKGSFEYNVIQHSRVYFGINYTESQGQPKFTPLTLKCVDPTTGSETDPGSTFCFQTSTMVRVSASVKIMVGFQFSLLFYDLAGPVITPDAYLRLDSGGSNASSEGSVQCNGVSEGTRAGSWAAICGGVEVRLGVQLNPWLNILHLVDGPTNWQAVGPTPVESVLLAGSVSISPSISLPLGPNQPEQFNATVAGTTPPDKWSPTWSVTCGRLDHAVGATVTYTAPSVGPNTCILVARMSIFGNLLDSLPCNSILPCFAPQVSISVLQATNQAFDYYLSNTGNINIPQGGSGSTTIIATLAGSSTQLVTLSCADPVSTLPYDALCSIFNPYVFPTGSRVLTISTSYSTPAGSFQVRVIGSPSGTTTIPTTFNLTITPVYTPSAPLNPSARGEPDQIKVQWQPPSSDGGSPVRWYGFYRGTSPGDLQLIYNAISATFFVDRSVDCQVTYYYSVTAFNAKGEGSPSPEVLGSPFCVTIPSASKSSADVGQSVTFSTFATGGSAGYTYSWSGLPVGCSSSNAPKVVCTPTGPGGFTVNVKAADSDGFSILSNSLSYTVYTDPSVATPTASRSVDVGQSVTLSASASGGSGGYDYTWLGLPIGCASASTPNLTCTPTKPGTFLVAIQATDSSGYSVTSPPLTYSVLSAPSVSVASPFQSPVEVGQSVTFSAAVSGGSGSFSYTWFGLPSGCQSSNTVSLTCTPSATGTYAITAQVIDSNGYRADSAVFTFTVRSSNSPTDIFGLDPMIFYGTLGGVFVLIAISAAVAIVRRRKATSVN